MKNNVFLFLFYVLFASGQETDFDKMIHATFKAQLPFISTEKLSEHYNNYTILDTREKNEYDISHLPNAIYVGHKDFQLKTCIKSISKNTPIVVYCSIGARSNYIGKKLAQKGFTVYNLYGGIFKWLNEKKKIVSANNHSTQKIHPYNNEWSKWLTNGLATYE